MRLITQLFGEWDVNGDGLISKKEMRQAMKVLGLGSGGERDLLAIEALFASVDAGVRSHRPRCAA